MFTTEYNCPFISTRGPRLGQQCDRINCKSPNHILEKVKRSHQKEREKEKRLHISHSCRVYITDNVVCGQLDCQEHVRISDFLNLPDVFFQIEESNRDFSYSSRLIEMYKYSIQNIPDEEYKNEFVKFINNHLDLYKSINKKVRCLYCVCLFYIFDTPNARYFRNKYPKFNKSIGEKIRELVDDNIHDKNISFCILYIQSTFTSDITKKYLRKSRNNTRRAWFLIRVLAKFNILYHKSINRPPLYLGTFERIFKSLQRLARDTYNNMNYLLNR